MTEAGQSHESGPAASAVSVTDMTDTAVLAAKTDQTVSDSPAEIPARTGFAAVLDEIPARTGFAAGGEEIPARTGFAAAMDNL
jgi:hypothetical protein